jgi:hypothetical protein
LLLQHALLQFGALSNKATPCDSRGVCRVLSWTVSISLSAAFVWAKGVACRTCTLPRTGLAGDGGVLRPGKITVSAVLGSVIIWFWL